MSHGPILLVGLALLAGLVIVKWLVFTGLLWLAIRIQKMQYNLLGLFGSSLLATLISLIPFVGPYLAWVVLVLCLWKVTREDIVPDCVLTAALANAVMFAINLFVIGALMGDLRPALMAAKKDAPPMEAVEDDPEEFDDAAPAPASAPAVARVTPPVQAPQTAAKTAAPAPVVPTAKRTAASVSAIPLGKTPYGLTLKGLILDPQAPSAMIAAGKDRFTIQAGESVMIPTKEGHLKVRCEEITRSAVRLSLNEGQELTLKVR